MRAVNLIPADQRAGGRGVSGRSGGAAYAVLALVGGAALLALLYGLAQHQVSSRRGEVASLKARAEQAQASAASLAPYTSFIALREERERAVSQLVDSRFDWAHVFHEVGRVLPSLASISTIEGAVGSATGSGAGSSSSSSAKPSGTAGSSAAAVASATPPGTIPTLTLGGCATSQAAVALTLSRLHLIDGVSEVTLQNSTKASSGGSGGAAAGQCPPGGPNFTAQLTFNPLPPASALSAPAVRAAANGGTR
jgi:hypothetical protein